MSNRVAAYVRVSTDSQVSQGNSLDDQARTIQAFADDRNLAVVGTYREEGESGYDLQRPQLDALRRLVRAGEVDAVAVRHMDRLTRNPLHLKLLLAEFDEHNVRLVTTDDRIGDKVGLDSSVDRWGMDLAAMFAEWQLERISTSTKQGLATVRSQGRAFNHPPFGFDSDPEGQLTPNREELKSLAWIRELDVAETSANEIARLLNEKGIPSKRGGTWQAKTVIDQLENLKNYADIYGKALDQIDEE